MKILILNESPIIGASWIGPYKGDDIPRFYRGQNSYKFHGFSHSFRSRTLLKILGSTIFVRSGSKIRFQKPQQNLNLPKGLNEF